MRTTYTTTRHHPPPLVLSTLIAVLVVILVLVHGDSMTPGPAFTFAAVMGYTSYIIDLIGDLLWYNKKGYSRQLLVLS